MGQELAFIASSLRQKEHEEEQCQGYRRGPVKHADEDHGQINGFSVGRQGILSCLSGGCECFGMYFPYQRHADGRDSFVMGQMGTAGNVQAQENITILLGVFGYREAVIGYAGYGAV